MIVLCGVNSYVIRRVSARPVSAMLREEVAPRLPHVNLPEILP